MAVHEALLEGDPSTVDQPMQPTRDELYYLETVVFHVGDTLFRVPKIAINVPGTIFEAMFTLPPATGAEAEGSSDENPIKLDVDEKQFRGFLRVLLRLRGQNVTAEDWLDTFSLATMWTFDDIRKEAIQSLGEWIRSQNTLQVILTAKKYNFVTWLKAAYTQILVDWVPTLPFDELTNPPALDWETLARLLYIKHLRETWQASTTVSYCTQCGSGRICCGVVNPVVEEIFKVEFEKMKERNTEEPLLPVFITSGRKKGKKGSNKESN